MRQLKIGIIGGGAIGLLCASYLSEHHDITVFTRRRKQQAEEIRALGIERMVRGETIQSAVGADTGVKGKFDLLIVTVKYHHLQDVLGNYRTASSSDLIFAERGPPRRFKELENGTSVIYWCSRAWRNEGV